MQNIRNLKCGIATLILGLANVASVNASAQDVIAVANG
jgi:hypothetical protein